MYLPPVIVIKSSELESDISRFKDGTLDEVDMAKLWKAFASVRHNTADPLLHACRQENFWWRVWGSKQRHLSGPQLGRICSHLCEEKFNLLPRRQSDLIEGSSSQITITSYAVRNNYERVQCCSATELHSKRSLECNPPSVLKKPTSPLSQGSRSDIRFISPGKTEEVKSTAHSVPYIILKPASINSCETKTESKRIFGPSISKKRNKVFNKKKQPLVVRRFGSHLSTDSARIADGRSLRRIIKIPSKCDAVSIINENSNSKALLAETRNSSAMPKLNSPNHDHYKMESKKREAISCFEDKIEGFFGDKMIKSGVSSVVRDLQDEVSRLGTDEVVVQEKMNRTLLTNYLKKSRSTSNNQISTTFENSHDSKHHPVIPDTRDLNEKLSLSRKKSPNLDSNGQAQVDGDLITSKITKSDKNNISLTLPVVNYNTTNKELLNETDPYAIGLQMPINIFAKRHIQPTFSLSESTDKLSISKSQLTLLIEKDRATMGGVAYH